MNSTDVVESNRIARNNDRTLKFLGAAVITPSGTYPGEDEYRRVAEHERIATLLKLAAEALHITNTSDWVARVGERVLEPSRTFADEHLACVVDIEYHKLEGGGGA